MKRKHSLAYLIAAFVFAQLAWLALLGLWIYWYVTNYIIFEKVGNQLSPQLALNTQNVLIFVLGIILMVAIEVAMVLTFRNLTVQMKLTNLYDNFIGNVSHELKSPLSSIQLYLETLSKKDVPPEKKKEFLGLMMKDTHRLNKLINSILEISKLEQKRIAHNYHIYNANDIIKDLVFDSVRQFNLPQNALKFSGSADRKCVIDKEAMQIVFDNLLSNSIKYSQNPAEIKVELSHIEKQIIIDFCDKGIGIGAKDQKKVFDKFHRIANPNVPNVKGTGLGLYWAKEIIKFHGGKISVFSDGKNKGTKFRIELPIYQTSRKFYINSLLRRTAKNQKLLESSDGE
jgi:two-component system, OmpR family, phosphate regulon sensor histidine kinase PhoR